MYFSNVVDEMDNSTVLIVIGDHGMTETGITFICLIIKICVRPNNLMYVKMRTLEN